MTNIRSLQNVVVQRKVNDDAVDIFKNYFDLLDKKSRFKFFLIIVLLIFSSLLETISIGSVFPLLLYTISPETIEGYTFLNPFFSFLDKFSINTSLLLIVSIGIAFGFKSANRYCN